MTLFYYKHAVLLKACPLHVLCVCVSLSHLKGSHWSSSGGCGALDVAAGVLTHYRQPRLQGRNASGGQPRASGNKPQETTLIREKGG